MKTKDAMKIGMALGRLMGTLDAWEESKHKRDKSGRFSSTGCGVKKMPSNIRENKLATKAIAASKSPEHWANKEEAKREAAVKKFKEQMKTGNLSAHEKRLIAEGKADVKSGEWSQKQYENMIRGIAISKMEREEREKPKRDYKTLKSEYEKAYKEWQKAELEPGSKAKTQEEKEARNKRTKELHSKMLSLERQLHEAKKK